MNVEINAEYIPEAKKEGYITPNVIMTPAIGDKGYWVFKVQLTKKQAIIGFPKFGTIGIDFMVEDEDWNTNLPCQTGTEEIYNHIKRNKGDSKITKKQCIEAIKKIQPLALSYLNKERN